MIQQNLLVNVKNLCSRKLWEILISNGEEILSDRQKHRIENELVERRHYLTELQLRRTQVH